MFSKSFTVKLGQLHNYFLLVVCLFSTPKLPTAHDNSFIHISSSSSHTPLRVECPVCAVQSIFLCVCVCVSLCLSLQCLWFSLISLKPYVFCHVLVFWMLAYGCHLFSPPALLPPCLLPHFSFICMLFLLFHTSLHNCHVLSLCAQILRPALNLQLMVGISIFLFTSLF